MLRRFLFPLFFCIALNGLSTDIQAQDLPDLQPITPENVAQLEQLAMLGRGTLSKMALSPDGQILAVASSVGVWLYNANDLTGEPHLLPHPDAVYHVVFRPDGSQLLSLGWDDTVRIWDLDTNSLSYQFELVFDPTTWDVALSPDNKTLAISCGMWGVQLWNIETGNLIGTLNVPDVAMLGLAFNSDGSMLAAGSGWEQVWTVWLWDVASQEIISSFEGHTNVVREVSFSPDDSLLASGSDDGSIRIWDIATGKVKHTLAFDDYARSVRAFAFNPSGTTLAVGYEDSTIRMWNIETETFFNELIGYGVSVGNDLLFDSSGEHVVASYGDYTVILWNVTTTPGTALFTLPDYTADVNSIAFSSNGNILVTHTGHIEVPSSNKLTLWDLTTGEPGNVFQDYWSTASSILLDSDRNLLISQTGLEVQLRDLSSGESWTLPVYDEDGIFPSSIALSPNGEILGIGSSGYFGGGNFVVQLWQMDTQTEMTVLQGETDSLDSIDFSPDGSLLAIGGGEYSVGDESIVLLWNMENMTAERVFLRADSLGLTIVKFNHDGAALAFTNMDILYFLDTSDGKITQKFETSSRIYEIAFNPEDSLIGVATSDGVFLLDFDTGLELAHFPGETVRFNPDGTILATGGQDGTVRLWGVPVE